ncbi:MAG: histidinol dehydrogenase [Chloracidobacterium sp.]|nr:histidinol dehydrogenase [Chloracidobacterium sp.]MDW8218813.1 histidinol dehydrogenase [Acidobacteriota bacterium]
MHIYRLDDATGQARLNRILERHATVADPDFVRTVADIIRLVRDNGDRGLFALTEQFDGVSLSAQNVRVEPPLLEKLAAQVPDEVRAALGTAASNIRRFHELQREYTRVMEQPDGVRLTHRVQPLEAVGLYVPGGQAAYPSTVLMTAIPAQVAGVPRLVAVTPAKAFLTQPVLAAALVEAGVAEVYTVGGAQAIAALAYGTESIPRVAKIVGPGNRYVTEAKRQVYGVVDVDAIAGPSEVVVIADDTADPVLVAADMLAQAEHDELAAAICITTSEALAGAVAEQLAYQSATLSRRDVVTQALDRFGAIFLVSSPAEAVRLVNQIAPEHVEVMTAEPERLAEDITFAGAIFIGTASAEAVGDYFAGPSHVLPTGGTARFFSPLGVYDFVRRTNVIRYTMERLVKTADMIACLADAEGLDGHARSIRLRMERHSGPLAPKTNPLSESKQNLLAVEPPPETIPTETP